MIKLEMYKCEICGHCHETEKDAKQCEWYHGEVGQITDYKFDQGAFVPKYLVVNICRQNGKTKDCREYIYEFVQPVTIDCKVLDD